MLIKIEFSLESIDFSGVSSLLSNPKYDVCFFIFRESHFSGLLSWHFFENFYMDCVLLLFVKMQLTEFLYSPKISVQLHACLTSSQTHKSNSFFEDK